MKKIILSLVCAITFFSFSGGVAHAVIPSIGEIFNIKDHKVEVEIKYLKESGLRDYTFDHTKGAMVKEDMIVPNENDPNVKGDMKFRVMVKYAISYLEKIFVVIAVLFFVWGGAELIIGKGDEEAFKTKKRLILGTAVGFIIILLATVVVDDVFFGYFPDGESAGYFLSTPEDAKEAATAGYKHLRGLFQYFTSWVVMAGVAYMIFSALKMIIAGGEDENQIANLKKRIIFTIFGMVILVSTEKFISLFQDRENKLEMAQVDKIIELLVDWINFALGFVGILAIVALIWGGVRLVTSMGQDEQSVEDAKRTIFSSIIGLVIAFSAWTLMYYFAVV